MLFTFCCFQRFTFLIALLLHSLFISFFVYLCPSEQVSSLSTQLHRLKSGRGPAHAVHADDAESAGFGGVAKAAAAASGTGGLTEMRLIVGHWK